MLPPSKCALSTYFWLLVVVYVLVTRLHLPHAVEARLHVHKTDVVVLTPETAGTVGV